VWFPRIIKTQRGKLNLGEVDIIRRLRLGHVAEAQAHSTASMSAERPSNYPLRLSPNSGTRSAMATPARPKVGVCHPDLGPDPDRIAHREAKACNIL
jgi:hypothetical protein